MKHSKNKRIFLLGASHGIGKNLAEQLLKDGHYLVLSSRDAEADLYDLAKEYTHHVKLINIDVLDEFENLEKLCQQAWAAFDGLDYWVYNVAIYEKSTLAEHDSDLYQQIMQVNFHGFMNIVNHLLPYFQNQQHGRWLVNGSISAHFGLPFGGAYSASKAALLNVCQSLQPELKEQGIDLQIINHGFVSTRLTEKNNFTMPFVLPPSRAANHIKQFMLASPNKFELKFPWQMRLIFALLNILPSRTSLALTAKLLPPTVTIEKQSEYRYNTPSSNNKHESNKYMSKSFKDN